MIIQIYKRAVFGQVCAYVTDPATAKTLAKLTGTKVLTVTHMDALRELGFTLETVEDPKLA
jgi:ribose 5-phosphate isomerase RpiB